MQLDLNAFCIEQIGCNQYTVINNFESYRLNTTIYSHVPGGPGVSTGASMLENSSAHRLGDLDSCLVGSSAMLAYFLRCKCSEG